MSALDRHPVGDVEMQFRAWLTKGWRITQNRNGTFYDITCPHGMNIKIFAKMGKNKKGETARQQVEKFLTRHDREHPGE